MAYGTIGVPGGGPEDVAVDDTPVGKTQIVKFDLGAEGANAPVVGAVPVTGPLTNAQLIAAIAGLLTAPDLAGLAIEAKQDTGNTSLAAILAKIIASPATETTLAAILSKIITSPATEATLALIKAKTDNLDVLLSTRTKPADAQHVIVDSGVTTGLTDAQLRATAVPVSSATLAKEAGGNLDSMVSLLTAQAFYLDGLESELGALAETAPASDTASSGLNGRLQRIAQRITSLIGLIPAALGAGGGLKVDQTPTTTTTVSNVNASATVVTLLAANAARRGASFYNDSTAALTLKHGSAASATDRTIILAAASHYELPMPVYPGIVTGLWASATGSVAVTEAV